MQTSENTSTIPVKLETTLLEVYEDRTEPPGSKLGANRPVGHAVIRIRIESLSLNTLILDNAKIEVKSSDKHPSVMSQSIGKITLGGRQIIEPGFHLTNRQGFMQAEKVKAIVTYQFNGQTYIAKSPVKTVKVNP